MDSFFFPFPPLHFSPTPCNETNHGRLPVFGKFAVVGCSCFSFLFCSFIFFFFFLIQCYAFVNRIAAKVGSFRESHVSSGECSKLRVSNSNSNSGETETGGELFEGGEPVSVWITNFWGGGSFFSFVSGIADCCCRSIPRRPPRWNKLTPKSKIIILFMKRDLQMPFYRISASTIIPHVENNYVTCNISWKITLVRTNTKRRKLSRGSEKYLLIFSITSLQKYLLRPFLQV